MSGEVYHLAKKDYLASVNNSFKDLLYDTDLADVTLACDDDTFIKAHRLILSYSSSFFRHIASKNTSQNVYIFLKGVKKEDLKSIIEFIYMGETNVASENLDSFLETSKELGIKGLTDILGNNTPVKRETNPLVESNQLYANDPLIERNSTKDLEKDKNTENIHFDQPIKTDFYSEITIQNFKNFAETEKIKMENIVPEEKKQDFIKHELEETVHPFECKKCSYKSTMYSDLKLHDIAIHRNSKYPCDHCEYHTNKKPAFIEHMEFTHGTNISF